MSKVLMQFEDSEVQAMRETRNSQGKHGHVPSEGPRGGAMVSLGHP